MAWWWCIVTFIAGGLVGVVLTAVIAADNANFKKDNKRWWEDE